MAEQKVTKKDIEVTLRNMSIELYAVEEALAHAGEDPDALTPLKISLRDLIEEVENMNLPDPIKFKAPTPPCSLRLKAGPDGGTRPGLCS